MDTREPLGGCVHEQFAAQARRTPEAVAVRLAGGAELTYRQLDEQANRLAHRLVAAGVDPEHPVAILQERSVALPVSILAVLKAGGWYLPLHSGHPVERMREITAQGGARVLLTDRAMRTAAPACDTVITVDDDPDLAQLPASAPEVATDPRQLAYVMFTSGSTGEPKGVAVAHREVTDFAHDGMFDPTRHTRVLMAAPYAFDGSVYELWVPLLHGGRVVLPPPGEVDIPVLAGVIESEQVTGVLLTAGLFRVVAEERPECFAAVNEVMTGGDVISPAAVHRIQERCPDTVVRATYGPTETTLFATQCALPRGSSFSTGGVPMGRALDDTALHVLDDRLRPVGPGAAGELYIAGAGQARGYLGRPQLTAERFVANPFDGSGERMYRTGDLVRRNGEGLLEFIGRSDDQVKIRGYRVELREIEHVLGRFPGLAQVSVVAQPGPEDGEKRLVAYVVPTGGADLSGLRSHTADTLPEYMVPYAFVELDALPLTGNGKVDYSALPLPETQLEPTGRSPRNPREEVLCQLFAEVLDLPSVTIDDSFFELGGHSLLATRLAGRMRSVLGLDLPIRHLLESPTVAGIVEFLDVGEDDRALGGMLALRAAGSKTPVFCIHPGSGLAWAYSGLLRHIPRGHPVYGIQADGLEGPGRLPRTLDEMAQDYGERIRRIRPEGPYALVGWSFGGLVAQSVATCLQQDGYEVSLLALLDAGREDAAVQRTPDQRELLALTFQGVDAFGREPGDGPLPLSRVRALLAEHGSSLAGLEESAIARLMEITVNNLKLGDESVQREFKGDLTFFEARRADGRSTADFWTPWVSGRIDRHPVPYPHEDLMAPHALAAVGPVLAQALKERA